MSLQAAIAQLRDVFSRESNTGAKTASSPESPPSGNHSDEVTEILSNITFDPKSAEWQRYLHSRPGTYARNLISYNKDYAVVLLGWRPGQGTPRHHHGTETHMRTWVKVLRGNLTLTKFRKKDEEHRVELNVGKVYQFQDPELGEHTLFNEECTEMSSTIAYSLHVYSPPLLQCCNNPVVYCGPSHTCACTNNTERVVVRASNIATEAAAVYTNFRSLVEVLHREILPLEEGQFHSEEHISNIRKLLEAMRFNRQEFSNYTRFENGKYTRNLVGYDVPVGSTRAKFTVLILCWDKGQMSPIHDHAGSSCWVKVLQGKLREIKYAFPPKEDSTSTKSELKVISDQTLEQEKVAYINDTMGIHAMGNPDSDQVTISMHVYSPPYVLCKLFDKDTSETKLASMSTVNMPLNPFRVVEPPNGEADKKKLKLGINADVSDAIGPVKGSPLTLDQFMKMLKGTITTNDGVCQEAEGLLARLKLEEREWQEFVHFDPFQYTRSLVALDSRFSLMVLCWNKGQATPIHDHGCGVQSWAKVLSGSLVLKTYSNIVSEPVPEAERVFMPGDCLGHDCYSGLHKLGNASTSEPAVSLHLFSPPYVAMGYIDEHGVERSIPVVHSATSVEHGPSCSMGEQLTSEVAMPTVFTDLESCAECFDANFNPKDVSGTTRMFERLLFHPEEWMKYHQVAIPMRGRSESLVAKKDKFALVLMCFPSGYSIQPTMSKRSWLKILQGQITERVFTFQPQRDEENLAGESSFEEIHSTTLRPGSVTFISDSVAYSFENKSTSVCFALRLVAC